jgi:hypothetical protein
LGGTQFSRRKIEALPDGKKAMKEYKTNIETTRDKECTIEGAQIGPR